MQIVALASATIVHYKYLYKSMRVFDISTIACSDFDFGFFFVQAIDSQFQYID